LIASISRDCENLSSFSRNALFKGVWQHWAIRKGCQK
jgi:hypothetical protein